MNLSDRRLEHSIDWSLLNGAAYVLVRKASKLGESPIQLCFIFHYFPF